MLVILGHLRTSGENVAKLKAAAGTLVAATLQEAGCLGYSFAEDIGEPGLIRIAERWADEAALAAHNKTPHLAAFMGALPSLGILEARIVRYEASGEKVLIG